MYEKEMTFAQMDSAVSLSMSGAWPSVSTRLNNGFYWMFWDERYIGYEPKHWDEIDENRGACSYILIEELEKGLEKLDDRSRDIVCGYYIEGMTLDQLAEKYKRTRERVSQIRNKALKALKKFFDGTYEEKV